MVTTFYPPYSFGGDAVFVRRLSLELADRGHRVDVIHNVDAYRSLGGRDSVAAPQEHPNVRVHAEQDWKDYDDLADKLVKYKDKWFGR